MPDCFIIIILQSFHLIQMFRCLAYLRGLHLLVPQLFFQFRFERTDTPFSGLYNRFPRRIHLRSFILSRLFIRSFGLPCFLLCVFQYQFDSASFQIVQIRLLRHCLEFINLVFVARLAHFQHRLHLTQLFVVGFQSDCIALEFGMLLQQVRLGSDNGTAFGFDTIKRPLFVFGEQFGVALNLLGYLGELTLLEKGLGSYLLSDRFNPLFHRLDFLARLFR